MDKVWLVRNYSYHEGKSVWFLAHESPSNLFANCEQVRGPYPFLRGWELLVQLKTQEQVMEALTQ